MNDDDVVVIGGGAAGLVAARQARRRTARVVIVQDGPVGGDCTFTGCVPSKTLLAAAAQGVGFGDAMARVHETVDHVAATEDAAALADEGIDVVAGHGRFLDPASVVVDGRTLRSGRFIVATGARPRPPPIPGLRESDPLTNETLFGLPALPRSLVILGGGPIGCEMAQAFARLGSDVTIVEMEDRLLPRGKPQASAVIAAALRRDGVTLRIGATVTRVERTTVGGVRVHTESGEPVVATRLLAATGRAPSGHGLGLEEIGVAVDRRGAIAVDDTMATNVSGIWAAGDVTGGLQFTHVAARMGWTAAMNALSPLARVRPLRLDTRATPRVTFTAPSWLVQPRDSSR